jgi:hypothetical protein
MPYVVYAPVYKKTNTPLHVLNRERSVSTSGSVDFIETDNHRFTSTDPRLLDSPRDQRLLLDSPPPVSVGTQPLAPGPVDRDRARTGFYTGGYETVYPGNRVYYTDIDLSQPLGPLLVPAYSVPTLLVDPMGSHKPYYLRVPVYEDNSFLFDYTSDRDQCEFREDLSSRQRQLQQKRRFGAFQLHNDPERYYPAYDRDDYGRLPLLDRFTGTAS